MYRFIEVWLLAPKIGIKTARRSARNCLPTADKHRNLKTSLFKSTSFTQIFLTLFGGKNWFYKEFCIFKKPDGVSRRLTNVPSIDL